MKFPILVVQVEIPALDRLLNHLEAADKTQAKIDAVTQRVSNLNDRLKAALSNSK